MLPWIIPKQPVAEQAAKGAEAALAICLDKADLHIGNGVLEGMNRMSRVATTGTLIGEAEMQWLHYAFSRLNLCRICSPVFATNAGSLRYSRNSSYRGVARPKDQHSVDGRYVDEIRLAVFKEDWLPLWAEPSRNPPAGCLNSPAPFESSFSSCYQAPRRVWSTATRTSTSTMPLPNS